MFDADLTLDIQQFPRMRTRNVQLAHWITEEVIESIAGQRQTG